VTSRRGRRDLTQKRSRELDFGVGRGSLMMPLLILLIGVHPATAVGTDLLYAASTKTAGTFVHATARTVDWAIAGLLAIGSVPATIPTIIVLSQFDLQSASAHHVINLTSARC
jgi:uncharacterized protein